MKTAQASALIGATVARVVAGLYSPDQARDPDGKFASGGGGGGGPSDAKIAPKYLTGDPAKDAPGRLPPYPHAGSGERGAPAAPAKSYKAEVIADNSGTWASNGLRFASKGEAEAYGRNLSSRWLAVRDMRATETDEPVTHTADAGGRANSIPDKSGADMFMAKPEAQQAARRVAQERLDAATKDSFSPKPGGSYGVKIAFEDDSSMDHIREPGGPPITFADAEQARAYARNIERTRNGVVSTEVTKHPGPETHRFNGTEATKVSGTAEPFIAAPGGADNPQALAHVAGAVGAKAPRGGRSFVSATGNVTGKLLDAGYKPVGKSEAMNFAGKQIGQSQTWQHGTMGHKVTQIQHGDNHELAVEPMIARPGDLATGKPGRPSQRHALEGHPYHSKSDDSLRYIMKDAGEALAAQPDSGKYADQVNDAATVLHFRKQNGVPKWYAKKYGVAERPAPSGGARLPNAGMNFARYSHGPGEEGFIDKSESNIPVGEMHNHLVKSGFTPNSKAQGVPMMGYKHWAYSRDTGPYHTETAAFDSEKGTHVRNVYFKKIRHDN